jgi:hexosaminidase
MSRRSTFIIKTVVVVVGLLVCQSMAQVNIIPKPNSMTVGNGTFTVPSKVIVNIDSESDSIYAWIEKLFEQAGASVQIGYSENEAQIVAKINGNLSGSLGSEGYKLDVTTSKITISAPTYAGLFYAVQSLRQLLPAKIERGALSGPVTIPVVSITDKPRYAFRSFMVDPARRFIPIARLKTFIERISLLKFNQLHIHLSDDQGWRLEIKSWPLLTQKASSSSVYGKDGGFYSQEEMKDLIKFAAVRNVNIIPEFDMPGHTAAAFFAYPGLGKGDPGNWWDKSKPYQDITTGWSTLICISDSVRQFVNDLYTEVADLFPSEIISVGGDEAQATDLQSEYVPFIRMCEQVINSKGRKMMGWEEIKDAMQAGSTSLPQAWRPAHASGSILSWCDNMFIDHANDANDGNAMGWCGSQLTLGTIFNVGADNSWLGIESCLWSEYLENDGVFDRRSFPRAAAVSEVGWRNRDNNYTYNEFAGRLGSFSCRFAEMGIDYYKGDNSVNFSDCAMNSSSAAVFQNFMPTMPTGVRKPSPHQLYRVMPEHSGKLFDIRGREIQVPTNATKSAKAALSRGIYFSVDSKDQEHSVSRTIIVGE